MRKTLIGAIGAMAMVLGLNTGSAEAQSWSNCYIGAIGGYASAGVEIFNGVDVSTDGFTVGAQAGCDVQVGQRFVIGAFGDVEFSDIEVANKVDLDLKWTLAARAGYLLTPTSLAYVLAGYTWTDLGGVAADYIGDLSGMTIGGGLETQFTPNWGTKLEYRYTMFDDIGPIGSDVDLDGHEIKVGLVYRFGAAPDVLK